MQCGDKTFTKRLIQKASMLAKDIIKWFIVK